MEARQRKRMEEVMYAIRKCRWLLKATWPPKNDSQYFWNCWKSRALLRDESEYHMQRRIKEANPYY